MQGGLWPRNTHNPEPPTVPLASLNEYVCDFAFFGRSAAKFPSVMI